MPSLTEAEYAQRADDWIDGLVDQVPLDRLEAAYDRADADHNNQYPVNYYEIKIAYERLHGEELAERVKTLAAERAANPIGTCANRSRHVDADGNIEVVFGGMTPNEVAVIIPCDVCRPVASQQRFGEEKLKYTEANKGAEMIPGSGFPALVLAKFEDAKKPKADPYETTKLAAIDQLDNLALFCLQYPDPGERGSWHRPTDDRIVDIFVNAKAYVRSPEKHAEKKTKN